MCIQRMKDLLTNPVKAINSAKKEKDLRDTFLVLIIEWFIFGLAAAVITSSLGVISGLVLVMVFVVGILATLFMSYLIVVVFNIIGGRGQYDHALIATVSAKFPISIGFILVALFIKLSIIGLPIAIIAGAIFTIIGVATLYRGLKELFGLDIITTWVGISIVMVGLILTFYVTTIGFAVDQNALHPLGGLLSKGMMYRGLWG